MNELQKSVEDLKNYLEAVDAPKDPENISEEDKETYQATKTDQTKLLLAKYLQSRMIRSLEVEDVKSRAMQILLERLEGESTSRILSVVSKLGELGQNDLALIMGVETDKKGNPVPSQNSQVNLTVNQQSNTQTVSQSPNSQGDFTNQSKTLKSLAKIHQALVDEGRVKNVEVENVEDGEEGDEQ